MYNHPTQLKFTFFIKQLLSVLIVFFFIYAQVFNFLPTSVSKIILALLLIGYVIEKDFFVNFEFHRTSIIILRIGILTFLYFFLVILANQSKDYTFLYNIFLIYFEFCFGSFLIIDLIRQKFNFNEIQTFKIITIAIFLQAVFIISSLLFPSLNSTFNSILPKIGNIEDESLIAFRGFTNSAGANLSVIQSIGVWLSIFLIIISQNRTTKVFSFLSFFLCIASTILVGRTGLFMSLVFLLSIFGYSLLLKTSTRFSIFNLLLISILSLLVIYFSLPDIYQDHLQENIFPRAFELFYSFNDTGKFTSDSTEDISKNMLFLPDNLATFFFGDGYFIVGDGNYRGTDSGYVRELFMGGVIGVFLINLIYWFCFREIYKSIKLNYPKSIQFLFILLLNSFLLIEIKEPFLLKVGLPSIIFLFFFNVIYSNNIIRSKEVCEE